MVVILDLPKIIYATAYGDFYTIATGVNRLTASPVHFIEITPVDDNSFKGYFAVFYTGDPPSKEVITNMASGIVGLSHRKIFPRNS